MEGLPASLCEAGFCHVHVERNHVRRVEIFRDFDIVFLHFVRRDGVKKKRMGSLLCYYCFAGNIALFERLFAAISLDLAGCRF